MDGMAKLMARAGKGLAYRSPNQARDNDGTDSEGEESDEDDEKENERPFEPLMVWRSPHNEGGEQVGLPSRL